MSNTACARVKKEPTMTNNLTGINQLWNFSNPEETRGKFEQLLVEQSETAPLDYILQIKTQIARTYSLTAKFEEAHSVLDEVEPQLSAETPVAKVRYLLERGRTFNSNNEKSKATELFVQAYNYGREVEAYIYSVDAAHMVGISSATLDDKLEWNQKGLEEAEKSNDQNVRRWIGVFYNNMGWDLFEAKHYTEALAKFELCRDFYQELEANDRLGIAKWSIAKTYRYLGRNSEALAIQMALLAEKDGTDESGYTYEELGELYLLKGETEKAKTYFSKAHEILSKDVWLEKNEPERLHRLLRLTAESSQ
tara:strand:- start:23716 stop:24639 length:924 start_codon:yes stop_codon:yes gene_type:complete